MYEQLKLTFSDFETNVTPVCVPTVRKIVHSMTLRNAGQVLIVVDVPMVLTGGGGYAAMMCAIVRNLDFKMSSFVE
jgi:hypothetical protein